MAILKRQFYYHEKGNHDEKWYYLARNTDTGRVFVIHEWAERGDLGEEEIEVEKFLASGRSSATGNLRELIGTLVPNQS